MSQGFASKVAAVTIIGGGPAGAATALNLAARGVLCLVIEAQAICQGKIGEVLTPNMLPLLHKMGLSKLIDNSINLPAYGNRCIWGSDRPFERLFITQTNNQGWHLNRVDFEQKLSQLTIDRGVKWLRSCRFLKANYSQGEWWVKLRYRGKQHLLKTKFLVDATGRRGQLTRNLGIARKHYDHLVGLACYFSLADTTHIPHFTHIEAVPDGWWYAALLSDRRVITVFMTDGDLCSQSMQQMAGYWQKIQRTQLIKTLFPSEIPPVVNRGIVTQPASTSCLSSPVGQGWLAVGDAAFAYDPISSYGIGSALGSGYYAAQAIADHLINQRLEALPAYQMVTEGAFNKYLARLRPQYLQEQRWRDRPFWQRRHQSDFACQWIN
ncbi:MAG: tryptophan 7-halogenase [Cyanobacteria bacterium P01_G01_bin.39]